MERLCISCEDHISNRHLIFKMLCAISWRCSLSKLKSTTENTVSSLLSNTSILGINRSGVSKGDRGVTRKLRAQAGVVSLFLLPPIYAVIAHFSGRIPFQYPRSEHLRAEQGLRSAHKRRSKWIPISYRARDDWILDEETWQFRDLPEYGSSYVTCCLSFNLESLIHHQYHKFIFVKLFHVYSYTRLPIGTKFGANCTLSQLCIFAIEQCTISSRFLTSSSPSKSFHLRIYRICNN